MAALFFLLLLFGLIYMCFHPEIHRFFRLECPDCKGDLGDWTLHNANPEMPVYRCKSCKKEWI